MTPNAEFQRCSSVLYSLDLRSKWSLCLLYAQRGGQYSQVVVKKEKEGSMEKQGPEGWGLSKCYLCSPINVVP